MMNVARAIITHQHFKRRSRSFLGVVAVNFSTTPEHSNIIGCPFDKDDVQVPKTSYFPFVWEKREAFSDKIALVDQISGKCMTYDTAYQSSLKFGSAIKDLMGSVQGDNVLGVLLPNGSEYPIIFSGSSGVKVITTTINPLYTPREIAHQLSTANAKAVITNALLLPKLEEAMELTGEPFDIIITDQRVKHHRYLEDMMSEVAPKVADIIDDTIDTHNDIVTLPFSSGTTGVAKGVMLTHENLVGNMIQQLHPDVDLIGDHYSHDQNVTLCVLPLYHIFGMNVIMGPGLRTGTKIVMVPSFEPKSFIKSLEDHLPTVLHLVPPLISFLVNAPEVKSSHMESVRHVIVGAAPLGATLVEQFAKKFPSTSIREAWGMTETSPAALTTPKDNIRHGSCGVPNPGVEVKIVDPVTGKSLEPGQRGELCCKGPMVMKGYLNLPKATANTIRDGWLHSGDVAYHDEDGFIFIVDRIKDLIKVKGFQVPPAELENLLRLLPGVKDVTILGVPSEKHGEVPRAYIVRNSDTLTTEDVTKYVSENVAEYKRLAGGVEFLEAIPKSGSGKILKRILLDEYKAKKG